IDAMPRTRPHSEEKPQSENATLFAANTLPIIEATRSGAWNATIIGGAVFLAIVIVGGLFLPPLNEVPDSFPAVVLWSFREASLAIRPCCGARSGLDSGLLPRPSCRIARER